MIEAARSLGWVITRKILMPCHHCTTEKAKKRVYLREHPQRLGRSTAEYGLTSLLSRYPRSLDYLSKHNWLVVVDERSDTKFLSFHAKKDDIAEYLRELFLK